MQNQNTVSQKLGAPLGSQPCQLGCPYVVVSKDPKEQPKIVQVNIDRTTQLLTSIAIAISDIVKVRQKHMDVR